MRKTDQLDQGGPPLPPKFMPPGILGTWKTDHLKKAVSFAKTGPPSSPAEMSQWRLDLVPDPQRAVEQLNEVEEKIKTAAKNLDEAPQRLDQFIEQGPPTAKELPAFNPQELPEPETDLLQLLNKIETIKEHHHEQVSFALGEEIKTWVTLTRQSQATMDHLTKLISSYAWVETQIQSKFVGQTVVDWSGDMSTTWNTGFTSDQIALHQRSLTLAIATRQTQIRTLSIAIQGAAKIASLLAVPGGALVALPVALKYVGQILAEINQI